MTISTQEPPETREIRELFANLERDEICPKLVKIEQTVYHGTSERIAKEIVDKQYVIESTEERGLLGKGAYFYENRPILGPAMASAWAKHDKKYPTQAVVAAYFSGGAIFDLTIRENREYLEPVYDWVVKRVKDSPDLLYRITVPRVVKFILTFCPQRKQIQAVRWNGFYLKEISATCQYGLAVRDAKCIKKLWLHS